VAKPFKRNGSRFWWIAPWIDGRQVRQSSGETDYDRAERKLKILEGKIAANAPITARTDRDSFAALLELVRTDYKIKKHRSLYDLEKRIDVHLSPALGFLPAGKAWTELDRYIVARQESGVKNGTINNELRIVRRAYRLGLDRGMVSFKPPIQLLPPADARDGYYSPVEFKQLLAGASPLLRNILIVAYITGWRLRSILRLQWHQVDLDAGFVWQTEIKNKKATRWPINNEFEQIGFSLRWPFEDQKRATEALKDRIIPWVFHRKGKQVKSVRGAFEKLLDDCDLERVFHDLRGTAIINLLEAGVDTPTIMNLVGLKTEHMVIHYAQKRGMREDRLREAGKLLEMRLKMPTQKASSTETVILRS
jgi:integrase